ncbi:MAG TPA: zinc-dependent peptidase [Chryseosolibacter sp.]|nr:zinc-dependent peptidase [Chryseosolibacter sp.]
MIKLILDILSEINKTFQELYYRSFIKSRIHFVLMRNHVYYRGLGSAQSVFNRKVWEFIRQNKFVPREKFYVRFSLKLMIASHAVQLSWCLPAHSYKYFDRIILYREFYQSSITNKQHKAEVNPGLRVIVFSVRAIHESITRKTVGVNVLLHEFAHALWLEHLLMNRSYAIFDQTTFQDAQLQIIREMENATSSADHFFRQYAFTNQAEFFAVAVENFFERPRDFQKEIPGLYNTLTVLFNQNPLALTANENLMGNNNF